MFKSIIVFLNRWHRYWLAFTLFILLIIGVRIINLIQKKTKSDKDYILKLTPSFKIRGIPIANDLNFCGELVPLGNLKVQLELAKEFNVNLFNQSSTLILNKKAGRFFPQIEKIIKENGVPDDFKYVAVLESGFTNSVAETNAAGFWGIMIPIGLFYGLEINEQVDERFNIEKATHVACKIIKDCHAIYKNWTLAAAAYNMGIGALEKQIKKQGITNYYELELNKETTTYMYRLLTFKELITRPEIYGYKIKKSELYLPIPSYKIQIDSTINDLSEFAISHSSNLAVLKAMNPWLLTNSLKNPERKKYEILFPQKGVVLYGMGIMDSINFNPLSKSDTSSTKNILKK